jgi:hypothetical protein
LNTQSTPRTRPWASTTPVGPVSRAQASLLLSSTTRTAAGRCARAFSYCAAEAPTVTGSLAAIAVATAANASCAGLAPRRQLSGRSGQIIQVPACGSNSAGMRKPSRRGVVLRVRAM